MKYIGKHGIFSYLLGLLMTIPTIGFSYPRGYKPPRDKGCKAIAVALKDALDKTQTYKDLLISKPGEKPKFLTKQKLAALNAQLQANKIAPQFNTVISMRIMGGIFAEKIDPIALTKPPTEAEVDAIGLSMDKAHRGCQVTKRYDLEMRTQNETFDEKWIPPISKETTNPDGTKTKIENNVEFFQYVKTNGKAREYTVTKERIRSLILEVIPKLKTSV